MVQNAGVLYILTCKCAWRHSGAPFFNNCSTSALQKVVRACGVLCNLTCKCASRYTACNSWTSKVPKVARDLQFFSILTCKCASRYSGVQFFHIATSKIVGYFSTQPTHKSLKNTALRDFPNISRLLIFFLLTFSQLYLLSSDSTSLLCFFIF